MDLENVSGAHHRHKAATDTHTKTNVSFDPGLFFIPKIVQCNIDILEKEGKVKDADFFCTRWAMGLCEILSKTRNAVVEHSITAVYFHT